MFGRDAKFKRALASVMFLVSVATVCCAQPPNARIEHLLQAAAHLEQAELPAQAAAIRELLASQDEQLTRRLLEEKLAQIQQLQAEVNQLQESLESSDDCARVTLRLKVLHLSLDKLRQVGLNLVSIRQLLESESPTTLVDAGGDIVQFLEMLQSQGFAELIAQPTLITRDGRRAAIEIASSARPRDAGRQIVYADPAAARQADRGVLRFECTPTVGTMELLQLDLLFQRSSKLDQTPAGGDDSSDPSKDKPSETDQQAAGIETRVEMLDGQTLILACRESGKGADRSTATLVLLEAEVVGKPQ